MDFQHVTINPSDGTLTHYTQRSTLDPSGYDRSITLGMAFTVAESLMFAFDSIRVSFVIGDRRYEVERTGVCHALNDTGCREHTWDNVDSQLSDAYGERPWLADDEEDNVTAVDIDYSRYDGIDNFGNDPYDMPDGNY